MLEEATTDYDPSVEYVQLSDDVQDNLVAPCHIANKINKLCQLETDKYHARKKLGKLKYESKIKLYVANVTRLQAFEGGNQTDAEFSQSPLRI
jgi:hypothetical protein